MKKSPDLTSRTHMGILISLVLLGVTVFLQNLGLLTSFNKKFQTLDFSQLPSEFKQEVKSIPPFASSRIPILIYHYVEYVQDERDTIRKSLNIPPHIFEKQIQTLVLSGFTFMKASDLGEALDGNILLPKKPVILTFDDGYRDFYTDVFPILKKYQVKATAYIVPGFIDGPNSMYLWQLKEVSRSGLVDIGAHTVNHTYLKGLSLNQVKFEVAESKRMLERELGIPIVSFAYPGGAFDSQAIEVVKNTGFTTAVTTVPGIEVNRQNRYFTRRIRPGARTGDDLLRYLEQNSFKPW